MYNTEDSKHEKLDIYFYSDFLKFEDKFSKQFFKTQNIHF